MYLHKLFFLVRTFCFADAFKILIKGAECKSEKKDLLSSAKASARICRIKGNQFSFCKVTTKDIVKTLFQVNEFFHRTHNIKSILYKNPNISEKINDIIHTITFRNSKIIVS